MHWSADQWFEEGCRLLDEHETAAAIEAFRAALDEPSRGARRSIFIWPKLCIVPAMRTGRSNAITRPSKPITTISKPGRKSARIHAAKGELESALEAFSIALSVHADYPDAHWHVADVLVQLGRPDEAAAHWRKYLEYDRRGPWAEQARQRLKAMGEEP